MFILLSCLADTSSADDIETRIGQTMRKGGIVITISSITDVIAFCAGAGSVFPSIRNFSLYTGNYDKDRDNIVILSAENILTFTITKYTYVHIKSRNLPDNAVMIYFYFSPKQKLLYFY